MSAIDLIGAELVAFSLAAAWIGSRQLGLRKLIIAVLGLSLIAWVLRFALMVLGSAPDVSLAEDYVDGVTLWNAAAEIADLALWLLFWSGIGAGAGRLARGRAKLR